LNKKIRDAKKIFYATGVCSRTDTQHLAIEMIRQVLEKAPNGRFKFEIGTFYNGIPDQHVYLPRLEDVHKRSTLKDLQTGVIESFNVMYQEALKSDCRWFFHTHSDTVFFNDVFFRENVHGLEKSGKAIAAFGNWYPAPGTGWPLCSSHVLFDLEHPIVDLMFPLPNSEHEDWEHCVEVVISQRVAKAALTLNKGQQPVKSEYEHAYSTIADPYLFRSQGMDCTPGLCYLYEDPYSRRWSASHKGVYYGHRPDILKQELISNGFDRVINYPFFAKEEVPYLCRLLEGGPKALNEWDKNAQHGPDQPQAYCSGGKIHVKE